MIKKGNRRRAARHCLKHGRVCLVLIPLTISNITVPLIVMTTRNQSQRLPLACGYQDMNTSANAVPQLCRKITVKAIQNLGTDQPIFDPSRIIGSFYLHHHVQNGSEITRLSPDDITRPMRIREIDDNPIQFLDLLCCINNQMAS